MFGNSYVRSRLMILSKAIGDVYGDNLSTFYSEYRNKGEICFVPHPLLAISIMIDASKASVIVKESECTSLPGVIKSIREFNCSSILDICEFVEDTVNKVIPSLSSVDQPVEDQSKHGWFMKLLNHFNLVDWWERT